MVKDSGYHLSVVQSRIAAVAAAGLDIIGAGQYLAWEIYVVEDGIVQQQQSDLVALLKLS